MSIYLRGKSWYHDFVHKGHLLMFDALPETREATKLLMDAACDWLLARALEHDRPTLLFQMGFLE
jgi:hypothetical protein